ncbi:MAG: hypothetical protein IPL61_16155 [Myxococcales bacterium]|nr:hypothetical protein [Myxococcales bacterium]
MRMLVLACLAVLPLAACFEPVDGGACARDSDCAGAVCTRVGECATEAYALRVTWTIAGQPASASSCTGIGELELTVIDPSVGTAHTVAPVPCGPGSFFYDKLPLGYTVVRMVTFAADGGRLGFVEGTAVGSSGVVALDLPAPR